VFVKAWADTFSRQSGRASFRAALHRDPFRSRAQQERGESS
jgi:hypothetical protein